MNIPHNQLLDISRNIFQLVTYLKQEPIDGKQLTNFRERIIQALNDLEKKGLDARLTSITLLQAKYALIAYIDEAVLSSAWNQKDTWASRPLQLEFFGERSAGEGFYDRLQKCREKGAQEIDLLELFYVCLQLGFKGKYRLKNTEQWLGLQADLRGQMEAIRGITSQELSPPMTEAEEKAKSWKCLLNQGLILASSGILLLLIYAGFLFSISYSADKAVNKIETMAMTVNDHLEQKNFYLTEQKKIMNFGVASRRAFDS